MRRCLSFAALFIAASLFQATAQTPTDPNEGSVLEYDGTNQIYRFKWWGRSGSTYFIQHSENLMEPWQWVPVVEPGNDSIKEWGFTTTGTKFFARLKYWTGSTTDPEGDDFDQDGVPNLYEVQHGNNPFAIEDSDADGLPDGWLAVHSGKFAIYPPSQLAAAIPRNQTANSTLLLHNDTATPVNYSVALTNQFALHYGFEDSVTGDAVYAWEDISTTGTLLDSVSSADDSFEQVALSNFAFPFYGVNYTSVFVTSNGLLAFGSGNSIYNNTVLPSQGSPAAIVAPLWDDLNPGSAGDIYIFQEATRAIIQYEGVSRYGDGGTYTFQVVLHSDGRILFRYKTLAGDLGSCTVGLQDSTRTLGLQIASDSPYLADGLAVDISPVSRFLSVNSVSGAVPAHSTVPVTAKFRSLQLPFGNYTATITTTHNAPDIAGPHVISATLNVINAPATIALVSPALGTTSILQGNSVQLSANATDADGISSVQFYAGAAQICEVLGIGPFADIWYNPSVGTHTLFARSVDIYNGTTDSAPVTLVVLPDADGDGMADHWEVANVLNPTVDDSLLDFDGDGAFNRFEYVNGTGANDSADVPSNTPATVALTSPVAGATLMQGQTVWVNASASDPDTGVSRIEFMRDGVWVCSANSSYLSYNWNTATTAGTAVLTAVAVDNYGHRTSSAPISITIIADSDFDAMPDDWETLNGLNPTDPADAAGDSDSDGYTNLEEFQFGKSPNVVEDTDGDGLPDGKERKFIYRTLSGGWGYFNIHSADTDGNGIPDGQENYDKDGLTVLQELALGTNPNLSDTDGDGVSDGKEVSLGTDPLVADAWANRDSDNDGLDDFTEITIGTNPFNPDTNGNGMPDGQELDDGGNPANPGPAPTPLPPTSPDPEPPGDPSPQPPPAIAPGDYDILVETKSVGFPKYGHATFQVLDPPKRYLTMTATQTYAGSDGEVESGPLGINGSVAWTIAPLTGNTATSGDNFVSSFGDPASPVRRSGTRQQSGYDDPPNNESDGTATINGVTTLSSENTTEMMVTNGKSKLEAFADDLQPGAPFAYRNVHENELAFEYQKVQFKFKWKEGVSAEQRHPIAYLLLFQPEDDPQTQENESTENAEVIESVTWNGQAGESQVFTVDPDQRKSGVDGSYRLLSLEIGPDAGMVGVVGDMVPSNKGLGGEKHFVTPKKTAQIDNAYVIFAATGVSSAVFQKLFEWGPEGEAVPGEPLKRKVNRAVAGKTAITVKTKGASQEVAKLNVWVVWASTSLVNLPAAAFFSTTGITLVDGTTADRVTFIASTGSDEKVTFEFKIEPATMFDLTSDVPGLTGAPISNTPGGTNPLKPQESLATGGASAKWDNSRAIQITITNPNIPRGKYPQSSLLPDNPTILASQPSNGVVLAFPTDDVTGNDDSLGTGLGGDPYTISPEDTPDWLEHGVGCMRSDDRPSSSISNYLTNGEVYEELDEFREFLRLNIGMKWYRASDFKYWEFRLRSRNDNGKMEDAGSYSGTSL
jgi:hypothetical protein